MLLQSVLHTGFTGFHGFCAIQFCKVRFRGQAIPTTPDGRKVTVKVDSQLTPGVRMSMIAEDLPPNAEINVHLHQREDEILFIRMGTGVATLGDREIPVTAGAPSTFPRACGTGSATPDRTHWV